MSASCCSSVRSSHHSGHSPFSAAIAPGFGPYPARLLEQNELRAEGDRHI
jgi:hypothetical protein